MSSDSQKNELKPYDYKQGCKDNDDVFVKKIYAKMPDFVVYRTDSAIRIDIDDDSEKVEEIKSNHVKIGVDLARIYSWLPESLSWSESINKQIARAIVSNILGSFDEAREMLKHAEDRIIKLKTIQGRLQYTLSAFSIVLVIFLISILYPFGESAIFSQVMLCGALGGVLSIAVGLSKLNIDIDANWQMNSLIGGSRILIAVTASLFSYFAIKSNIAFSFVNEIESNYGIFMVAMVAGFAEMLIPNIMNNLAKENDGYGKNQDKT
ncbi:hypothetical protein McPS_29090 [Marichromatium sp. PS1]|uniref:hypothetical protein n=1 Tax=Marichromatium sp. PS1 TaxID=3138932 RepID=UPI0032E677D2